MKVADITFFHPNVTVYMPITVTIKFYIVVLSQKTAISSLWLLQRIREQKRPLNQWPSTWRCLRDVITQQKRSGSKNHYDIGICTRGPGTAEEISSSRRSNRPEASPVMPLWATPLWVIIGFGPLPTLSATPTEECLHSSSSPGR